MQNGHDVARLFLQFTYPQIKDLALHFLTLQTAVLVFSLAFAEKIVRVQTAPRDARGCVHCSWGFQLSAVFLVCCGIVSNFWAGEKATFSANFVRQGVLTYFLLSFSGAFFVIGLLLLVVATVPSRAGRGHSPDEQPLSQ